jgi:hypothetical protein
MMGRFLCCVTGSHNVRADDYVLHSCGCNRNASTPAAGTEFSSTCISNMQHNPVARLTRRSNETQVELIHVGNGNCTIVA